MGQIIVIDEIHKDKRASRRRRAWGRRNSGGIALRRWYRQEINYTMIAAMNIDGFVDETVNLYLRDEISEEGAAGTVDEKTFLHWVRNYLVKVLGNHKEREENSIVIMDNASTHMSEEVREAIENAGAYLLYSAPYSPDLSPIEYCFNVYKAYLKRYSREYVAGDFFHLHMAALDSITADIAIKEFRKCGIPYSDMVLTSDELVNVIE